MCESNSNSPIAVARFDSRFPRLERVHGRLVFLVAFAVVCGFLPVASDVPHRIAGTATPTAQHLHLFDAETVRVSNEARRDIFLVADAPRDVSPAVDQGILAIRIVDDGQGFDVGATLATGTASGLAGMRERAEFLDGSFRVVSARGGGTCLTATIPLAPLTPTDQEACA